MKKNRYKLLLFLILAMASFITHAGLLHDLKEGAVDALEEAAEISEDMSDKAKALVDEATDHAEDMSDDFKRKAGELLEKYKEKGERASEPVNDGLKEA
jgi:F0F1-type ATP synthase membrane subunit b/b'